MTKMLPTLGSRLARPRILGLGGGVYIPGLVNPPWAVSSGGGYASPTTTLGDLIRNDGGGNESDERLPVGTDGQVLAVVSGEPAWADVGGGGGGVDTIALQSYARRAPFYEPFTPAGDDDEFDDESFSGWTLVNSGAPIPTITEDHDIACIVHPGGDAAAEITAWLKAMTLTAGDYVEGWFELFTRNTNTPSVGVIMADGETHGAGTQVFWEIFNTTTTQQLGFASHTNFATAGSSSVFNMTHGMFLGRGVGLRLVYEGSNNWSGWVSINGFDWLNVTGTLARTMTPTHAGFFTSTWASAIPLRANVHYCRFSV